VVPDVVRDGNVPPSRVDRPKGWLLWQSTAGSPEAESGRFWRGGIALRTWVATPCPDEPRYWSDWSIPPQPRTYRINFSRTGPRASGGVRRTSSQGCRSGAARVLPVWVESPPVFSPLACSRD